MRNQCKKCGMYPHGCTSAICAKCEAKEEQRVAWLEERFDEIVWSLAEQYETEKLVSLFYAVDSGDIDRAKQLLDIEVNKRVEKLMENNDDF